jgi:hypothetical protein
MVGEQEVDVVGALSQRHQLAAKGVMPGGDAGLQVVLVQLAQVDGLLAVFVAPYHHAVGIVGEADGVGPGRGLL